MNGLVHDQTGLYCPICFVFIIQADLNIGLPLVVEIIVFKMTQHEFDDDRILFFITNDRYLVETGGR